MTTLTVPIPNTTEVAQPLTRLKKKRNGGIQKGTSATSVESAQLDADMRIAAKQAMDILAPDYPRLTWARDIKRANDYCVGMCPDGGCWYYDGKLIMVAEAKYQGPKGNAAERWYKNYFMAFRRNPEVSYLTFVSGAGSAEKVSARKIFTTCLAELDMPLTWDIINPGAPSFYGKTYGFEMDNIVSVMVECIKKTVGCLDD